MKKTSWYKGKKVFVTGCTGFKGSWLCMMLKKLGADVTGYALPPRNPSLFSLAGVEDGMRTVYGDIRDFDALYRAFEESGPEVVFHLAAQPVVRESYQNPVYTYETNVLGTVHICECIRKGSWVCSFLNVTTDKVYDNREWPWGYRETDALDGYDPYSNSKSCAEMVTHSYQKSFLRQQGIAVSTARAGNVIGGGDFSKDRIVPDCIRAAMSGKEIVVRNPASVRPYQHVLEPLSAYLLIAERQAEDGSLAGAYNVGPEDSSCITTGELAEYFCRAWGNGCSWHEQGDNGPHEAGFLKLDCSKIRAATGWRPVWDIGIAVDRTVEWVKCYMAGDDPAACMRRQITQYWSQAEHVDGTL